MKTILGATLLPRTLLVATLLIGASVRLFAQSDTNDLGGLEIPLVESPPLSASFRRLSSYFTDTNGFIRFSRPPTPRIPLTAQGLPVYYLTPDTNFGIFSTNSYVIDDSSIVTEQGGWQTTSQEESAGSGGDTGDFGPAYTYPSNYLYLIIDAVSNSTTYIRAMGTVPDQIYELLSRTNLNDTNWTSEGTFLGAENQDWTPTSMAVGTRTNSLFIWCRSWADSDGDGLPDWWEMQYGLDPGSADTGNTGVPDGYKNPAGDGWSNIYKYEHGMNPGQFYTPPPPRNVQARLDYSSTTNAILTWESGGGPVTNYGILSDSVEVGTVNSSTFTFTQYAGNIYDLFGNDFGTPSYRIRAYISNGSHADSAPVRITKPHLNLTLSFLRGPSAQNYLAVQSPPPDLAYLRIYLPYWWISPTNGTWLDVSPTNFINGIASIPGIFDLYDGGVIVQPFATNGDFGETLFLDNTGLADTYWFYDSISHVTAADHLKANLQFLLRSATVNRTFSYISDQVVPGGILWSTDYPEQRYARPASPTSYEYYGYHSFSRNLNYSFLQPIRPVLENWLWRNFVFNSSDGDTGASIDWDFGTCDFWRTLDPSLYVYSGSQSGTNLPLAFTSANSTWLFAGRTWDDCMYTELGLSVDASGNLLLGSGMRNCYGLTLNSEMTSGANEVLYPGVSSSVPDGLSGSCWPEFAIPALQTVDFYFASQTPYFRNYTNAWRYSSNQPAPPLPGSPTFSVTNVSPLLIAPFGQPFTVSGWAKMTINNGYSGKYAYLEQYWDGAYKITNGVATTNQTGLLSPYGEFFPTEPGPAALLTMPDIDTGQRGTGIVNVIKLQLDVNHDGVMDLSFGGSDNTSKDRPFVFWVNNDSDITPLIGGGPGKDVPDWEPDYSTHFINSQRDLEDFARLWICGMPELPAGSGYHVTLGWGKVVSGNPAIALCDTVETNGGTGYLTDTNVAAAMLQRGPDKMLPTTYIPTITSNSPLTLPANLFTNGGNKYFLFEGAGIGSGELVLTISQGTNILSRTSTWLDLHDVKDFYERVLITNSVTGAISSWTSGVQSVDYASSSELANENDLLVLVHGINVSQTEWLNTGDTTYKRLYWAGYHGKFMTLKWPCTFLTPPRPISYNVFNLSEAKAYKSSQALTNYLAQLHTRFPDHRLHLLAHSQGNAIVSEALSRGVVFDTYILTQAATPASCYDVNYPLHAGLSNAEAIYGPTPEWQPMGYRGAYTNLPGRIINFYNTNDPVVALWINDQGSAKPNLPSTDYHYNGTVVTYEPPFGSSYTVTDPQESRAFASRSRTEAIGRSPPESGHGVITSGIDLHVRYGFDKAFPADHSAQWERPIQGVWGYYDDVLDACLIPTIQR